MNPTVFIELLNQDNPSDFKDIKQLDRLLNNHPYFQIGLAAKSRFLKAKQHIDFIKTSRQTAAIFPNRSKLYQYLNKTDKSTPVFADEDYNKKEAPNDKVSKIKLKPVTVSNISENKTGNANEKLISDSPESELEKNYLAEAINQSIQIEATGYSVEIEIEDEPLVESEEVLSFSDWLTGKTETSHLQFQNNLIDNFISEEPVISKVQKTEFYSPIEKGKESISDSNLPVSETLAKVFANQGNKSMAVKMYEKLMLNNPEKSTYFAGLIKKLKEK
jgi:hypothetical protein